MAEGVEIYADKGDDASQADVFVLAGACGAASRWEWFADDWNAVTNAAEVTEPLHAMEFEGAGDQFSQFGERGDEWRPSEGRTKSVVTSRSTDPKRTDELRSQYVA